MTLRLPTVASAPEGSSFTCGSSRAADETTGRMSLPVLPRVAAGAGREPPDKRIDEFMYDNMTALSVFIKLMFIYY